MARNSARREGGREDRESDAPEGRLHCAEPTSRVKGCSSDVADQGEEDIETLQLWLEVR